VAQIQGLSDPASWVPGANLRRVAALKFVPLKKRGDAINGAHHAFPRGNSGMVIFRDNADRQVLLVLLKGVVDAYEWDLRAYCLMRNHFHLVVITATANFSDGMQRLLSAYVRYFNGRHERGGHLFKRPFKSEPIKDERQLAVAVGYVGDNPVRAGICTGASEYRWSSHGEGDDAHRAALMYPNSAV
jgi:putative transposase